MDIDLKARLLMGLDISVHNITIKNYKLGEIFKDIGLTRYLQMSNLATRKPKDFLNKEYIDEFKNITMFDIFCMSAELNDMFIQFLNLFTGYEWGFINTEAFTEFHAINELGSRVHINKENFNGVFEVVKVMYCIDVSRRESDREDIDDEMRELLREFEEEEAKIKKAKGGNITIISIIDGISNKHSSLNLLNIWEYTMYQTMHTYYGLNKVDNENRVMAAIYGGTIDSGKTDLEKMHWANELD